MFASKLSDMVMLMRNFGSVFEMNALKIPLRILWNFKREIECSLAIRIMLLFNAA